MSRLCITLWAAAAVVGWCGDVGDTVEALQEKINEMMGGGGGPVALRSGVKYLKVASGDGPKLQVNLTTDVTVQYEGRIIDKQEFGKMTVFDTTYDMKKPPTLKVRSFVPGLIEALQLMKPGDKWEVLIPAKLAYGKKGRSGKKKVPPNADLMYTMEVLQMADGSRDDEWDKWLHEPLFFLFGFIGINRTIIMPLLAAVFVTLVRLCWLSSLRTSATAKHIVCTTEELCYKALSRVNKGEDFAALAKELSTCSSGKKGGNLGKFFRDTYPPEFEKVVFDEKTDIGKAYGPIKTQFGWHVVVVESRFISEEERLENYREAQKAENIRKKRN
eukprot:TRINITY_DN64295_c0_g1_i1.p1 TRINITY_DN64295_c0_g1~~TRINITY_DN64295_c0_g1_i1.p1  ORF type:complete len:330 (+),score=68.58 TRINITY_DN64295_c0_g1_i1:82-1071(+)